MLSGAGLYRSRLVLSLLDDLPRLLRRWLTALALLLVITHVVIGEASGFGVAAIAGVALLAIRCVNYQVVRLLRSKGVVAHATIVVGADATGQEITQRLIDNPHYGLAPLGFLDRPMEPANSLPAPILGKPHDLLRLLDQYSPRALILAGRSLPDGELVDLVRACHRHRCDVFVIPRLAEVHYVSDDVEFVWDTPLVRLHRSAYRSPAWRLKRFLDVVFSSLALLILSPLMLLCAFAVYLEGGKGVIFRQERVGRDGVHFSLLKFRSLRPANENESQHRVEHLPRLPTRASRPHPAHLLTRRAAPADQHLAGRHESRRTSTGTPALRARVRRTVPRLRISTPGAVRAHGLGSGPRSAGGHLDR